MARRVDVYLHRHLAGHLIQDEHDQMAFKYSKNWLENPNSIALSHSLPLRKERYARDDCQGYFAGILPEDAKRRAVAKNLGISAGNDFAMLEQIGGECAGAVTFLPEGESLPEHDTHYRNLTNQELASLLRTLPRRPLLAGDTDIRLSLAGAQDKIAVYVSDGTIALPLGGAPSTHILKPAIEQFAGVVFNEAFSMQLSRAAGLPTAKVQIGAVDGIDYLLVERYDRVMTRSLSVSAPHLERLHQEDFCQALGIISERKYQNEGGPTMDQCFELMRETSSVPVIDLQSLIDGIIFNFLIGNNDAHGKNFSLLYNGETRLAPFYDLLSTVYYPELAGKMAMKLGGEYDSNRVFPRQFERLAEETGLGKPMVKQRVRELAETLLSKIPEVRFDHPVVVDVANLVQKRCERTLSRWDS